GSNGTQYLIAINTGSGDGTLALSFTPGLSVTDLANNPLQDNSPQTGATYTIDKDAGEQAALSLAVIKTTIDSLGALTFQATVGGLEREAPGTVPMADGPNHVSIAVAGGQTNYSASLSALADGTVASLLSVNTDPAGNAFAPVPGNSPLSISGV